MAYIEYLSHFIFICLTYERAVINDSDTVDLLGQKYFQLIEKIMMQNSRTTKKIIVFQRNYFNLSLNY